MTQPDGRPEDPWAWLKALALVIGVMLVVLVVIIALIVVHGLGQH